MRSCFGTGCKKTGTEEKWPLPETISELRAFLGFANYYHTYIPIFAHTAGPLMDKLKVGREDRKKGSKKKVAHGPESRQAIEDVKKALLSSLQLFVVNPNKPFVLRVDASTREIRAALEQLPDSMDAPLRRKHWPKKRVQLHL